MKRRESRMIACAQSRDVNRWTGLADPNLETRSPFCWAHLEFPIESCLESRPSHFTSSFRSFVPLPIRFFDLSRTMKITSVLRSSSDCNIVLQGVARSFLPQDLAKVLEEIGATRSGAPTLSTCLGLHHETPILTLHSK
jgi:hypothetical protein